MAMTNIGRNDPCPCGSGRKYKRCCLGKESKRPGRFELDVPDPGWRKIRHTDAEMTDAILHFARARYGPGLADRARQDFLGKTVLSSGFRHLEQIFIPWMAFVWRGSDGGDLPGRPLAAAFLDERRASLDEYQRAFIRAACAEPFSFFLVTSVEPGLNLSLRDLLLGREITVKERSGSQLLRKGQIVYARVLQLESEAIFVGLASVPLSPRWQYPLLEVRKEFARTLRPAVSIPTAAILLALDSELREKYFESAEEELHPAMPKLTNTDGDPLVLIQLKYELLCPPSQALESLRTLVLPDFRDGIEHESVRDKDGNLIKVSFRWQKEGNRAHKHWTNTTLGEITIERNSLVIDVNSEKRARKIRAEVRDRLGHNAVLRGEKRRSVEEALEEQPSRGETPSGGRSREPELAQSPSELREVMKNQMERFWEAWLDEKIPILHNRTPRQAARTEEGRELLEALLVEYEYRNGMQPQIELRADIPALRHKLGLPPHGRLAQVDR